jgi:DNA polymerase elongation subunit (family B)
VTGFDSETHKGQAVLLATPRVYSLFPKTFEQCVTFLASIGDPELICWNADYDVGAILKFLPPALLERLYQLGRWQWETRLPGWSSAGKISLHFVPRKFLRVHVGRQRFTVYDLAQFYNMSLNRAAKDFLGEEKSDPGVAWDELKNALAHDPVKRKRIVDYCMRDALLVERLAALTNEKFSKIGVPFENPVSYASLSYRVFKSNLDFEIPREVNEVGRESFRGGMIECLRAGMFSRAWYIDLRSAYPSSICQLQDPPNLWVPIEGGRVRKDAAYASIECTVHVPATWHKGWLPYVPVRDGLLFYPVGRWRTWLDLYTYRQVHKRGMVECVHGGVQGLGYSARRPFRREIERLFKERSEDAQKKWAVKIILNSLYGKFAETIGYKLPACDWSDLEDLSKLNLAFEARERFTNHTNFFMAGEVTSRTRWRLIEDLKPADVISYATDGVFLKRLPVGLDFGDRLGQWSPAEEVRDLVVVGSGIYCYKTFDPKVNAWVPQTRFRGFASGLDLYTLLDRNSHNVGIELQRNQKLGSTIVTGRWDMFNVIHKEQRVLNVNFDRKRKWETAWKARDLLRRSFESAPWYLTEE